MLTHTNCSRIEYARKSVTRASSPALLGDCGYVDPPLMIASTAFSGFFTAPGSTQ